MLMLTPRNAFVTFYKEEQNKVLNVQQATNDLKQASQNTSIFPSLFAVIATAEKSELRKLAAVVFRRKISKKWTSLSQQECVGIRQAMLEQLGSENEPIVLQSLCQIIGEIAKHELSKDESWPDLFIIIKQTTESSNARSFEMGLYLLNVICETSTEQIQDNFLDILGLLANSLMKICSVVDSVTPDQTSSITNSMSYAIQAFNAVVPYLGSDHMQIVRSLIPLCVKATQFMLVHDEDLASDSIEVFESLIEAEVSFIAPFVKDLVGFSLQVSNNNELEDTTRVRCLSLLSWIISLKKKSIIKLGLIGPILDVVYPLTTQPCGDEDENFTTNDNESNTPVSSAVNVINEMALHLPPEKLFADLLPRIKASVESNNEFEFRGALLAIACAAEGTAEYIKHNHLKEFLELTCRSVVRDNVIVRNASLFAIGQFSEHLQPDISEYASELIPLLFDIINKTSVDKETTLTKAYYAMENFIENLSEDKIPPYLSPIMEHLLNTLRTTESIHAKELVVSSIGAVANAAKQLLLPYLEEILTLLKSCLPQEGQTEDVKDQLNLLHTQTLDTLAVIARNVGKPHFTPLAEDCMKLGINLLESDTDPDMKRATYGLFSAMAIIMEEHMVPYLPNVMKYLLESISSIEGVVLQENGNCAASTAVNLSFLDDTLSDDITSSQEEDEEDLEDIKGFSVENSYIDEKADACETAGEISKYVPFNDFFESTFTEVFKVVDFPHPDVRKMAIGACSDLITSAFKQNNHMFSQFLSIAFPMMCTTVSVDTERFVVMATINALNEMIKVCADKAFPAGQESLHMLMQSIVMIMQERAGCQDNDDDEAVDDQQQAEHDEMLYEMCGDLLPSIAGAVGTELFLPLFSACLPTLISKLKSTCTIAERSFASGTIAETFEKLGENSASSVVDVVIPKLLQATRDSNDEVRNNSAFAIGVVLMNGGTNAHKHYPASLQCLHERLSKENNRRVIDNILGAVSRLIIANNSAVPLKDVTPVLLKHLPIIEDHEEDQIVYTCLSQLMHDENVCDASMQTKIIELFSTGVLNSDVKDDVRASLAKELKTISKSPLAIDFFNNLPSDKQSNIFQLIQGA